MKEVSSNIYATGQATHRNWQPMPGAHAVGRADPARRGSQCSRAGRRNRARTDAHAEGWKGSWRPGHGVKLTLVTNCDWRSSRSGLQEPPRYELRESRRTKTTELLSERGMSGTRAELKSPTAATPSRGDQLDDALGSVDPQVPRGTHE